MKWTKQLPVFIGAYWFRNKERDCTATVVMVRQINSDMLIDNCEISRSSYYSTGEWAGPIALPVENALPIENLKIGDKVLIEGEIGTILYTSTRNTSIILEDYIHGRRVWDVSEITSKQ